MLVLFVASLCVLDSKARVVVLAGLVVVVVVGVSSVRSALSVHRGGVGLVVARQELQSLLSNP